MRRLGLKSQLLLAIAVLQIYSLGVGLSTWIMGRAHARLERAFHQELVILKELPQLKDLLRQLDQAAADYMLTGSAARRARFSSALIGIRRIQDELTGLVDSAERDLLSDLDRQMTAYLARQNQWIARKQAGRLTAGEAALIASQRAPLEAILGSVAAMRDRSAAELERRRRSVQRASNVTLALVLATGFAASLFLAWLLSVTLIKPIARLRGYARAWTLDKEWDLQGSEGVSPEVGDLYDVMGQMSSRLNVQFRREHDVARFKTRLVAMVSHEFNNHVNIIQGVTYLLQKNEAAPDAAKRAHYYEMIQENVRALTIASANILNMAGLESGKLALHLRPTDVGRLLKEAAARLEFLSERKSQKVELDAPEELPEAKGDPEALALVLTNLLSNAIKYTPDGGKVTLGASLEEGGVKIFCRDTGIGIRADDRDRVLSGFYRTEEGRKAAEGFGLGLPLAHGIIEAHGAALAIETAPQKGSTFSFILPFWQA